MAVEAASGSLTAVDDVKFLWPEWSGATERTRRLERLQAYADGEQHDHKRVSWDGFEVQSEIDRFSAEAGGYGLPNTLVNEKTSVPLSYRKPSAPFALAGPVVQEFTDLVLGEGRRPVVFVRKSKKSQEFYRGVMRVTDWWAKWTEARDRGGAVGSAVISFYFDGGTPRLEVHRAQYVTPVFKRPGSFDLDSFTVLYQFSREKVEDLGNGRTRKVQVDYWYKRTVDGEADTLYNHPRVEQNKVPRFTVQRRIEHGWGFCPAVWVQNHAKSDEVDGVCDFKLAIGLMDEIDKVLSQSGRGALYNCDPTAHLATDLESDHVVTGSFHVLKTEKGGSASMLEMTGTGVVTALDVVERYRQYALILCRCVLDVPQANARDRVTAAEIESRFMTMFAQASRLRTQYEEGMVRLLLLLGRAALAVSSGSPVYREVDGKSELVRQVLVLPDGVPTEPDEGNFEVKLVWGRYFRPTPTEVREAVTTAVAGVGAGVMDLRAAAEYLAPFLGIDDSEEFVARLEQQQRERDELKAPDDWPANQPKDEPGERSSGTSAQ